MNMPAKNPIGKNETSVPSPDFTAIKAKQRVAWGSGDYAVVGSTLQIVGETLCEALDVRSGQTLLDVAAGNGNVALAAARRFMQVTCTDYVPQLLAKAQARAQASGLTISFQEADVEQLPFPDQSFDNVTSSFGAMFAPNQPQTATEMFRVLKPGGKIGMANWTPDSFIGGLFKTLGRYVPPAPDLSSPALWGTSDRLQELFPNAITIECTEQQYSLRYPSAQHWVTTWREIYGPLQKAFSTLSDELANDLTEDLLQLIATHNRADDGTMVVPSTYLQVIVKK